MDAQTRYTIVDTEISVLINEAVVKGMNMGSQMNDSVAVNEVGHRIPNTDANLNQLINIIFDPNLTKIEKINKIINDIMAPHHVDIIVTGQYIDEEKNPLMSIQPVLIVKSSKEILTFTLQFKKMELMCKDKRTKKEILCDGASMQISEAVMEILKQL
jgi:hypothetical protein